MISSGAVNVFTTDDPATQERELAVSFEQDAFVGRIAVGKILGGTAKVGGGSNTVRLRDWFLPALYQQAADARVFDAALRGANHEAMLDWQEHIGGHTRRGKGGRLGEEAADHQPIERPMCSTRAKTTPI